MHETDLFVKTFTPTLCEKITITLKVFVKKVTEPGKNINSFILTVTVPLM